MSDDIGEMQAHVCGQPETCFIRKKKNNGGRYPLYLWHKKTGPQFFNTVEGQDWILDSGVLYDENGDLPKAKKPAEDLPADLPADPPEDLPEETTIAKAVQKTKADDGGWFL